MTTMIHPTAIVSAKAQLGQNVTVGPYSVVEDHVQIGDGTTLQSHVCVRGLTQIGSQCTIFPFAVVGSEPQYLKYAGEPTKTIIGNRVILRESTTVHRGTPQGRGLTEIGDDCFLMAYTHVAHDCKLGKGIIIANSVQMAGHVQVDDYANIGGLTAIRKDVPPFVSGKGQEFKVQAVNVVGMSRRGVDEETIKIIEKLFKTMFFKHLDTASGLAALKESAPTSDLVKYFINFVEQSKIGIARR
jgi:UDP-N-acetylglucosamine acyltransferase